jgi:hypothetical protein
MSRVIKIPFPDITYTEKTRLIGQSTKDLKVSKGASSIYVRNPTGLSVGDFIILEAFESEDAEIVKISNIQIDSHAIDLTTPLLQDHLVGSMGLPGVIVMKTLYNQVRVFKGTTNDVSLHTEITVSIAPGPPPVITSVPVALRPDNAYTYYVDGSGLTTDFYSYQYWNSATATGTNRVLYVDSSYDSILTVDTLKRHFMFGLDLTDDDGYPFPNSMLEFGIRAAVDSLEKTLQVKLKSTAVFEYHDFFAQDYRDFCFIQLNNWPVISVDRIEVQYPTASTPINFPIEWVQLRKERGSFHLVPTTGSLSTILMGRGGDYLTFVWRGFDFMPNLWRIWYTAGFENGMEGLNDVIGIVGKMACFYPLNIAGDLVGGIAIASKSIGIDGLSQSINTTSSPENAGYSARLRQYQAELKVEIPRLQQFFKGFKMAVL